MKTDRFRFFGLGWFLVWKAEHVVETLSETLFHELFVESLLM
jgi:hypothetical protein